MLKTELLDMHFNSYRSSYKDRETVPGCGNTEANLLLIGEAPGKDEIRLSRPFSGKAGRHLDEFLSLVGILREDIYITNTVKYRLAKTDPVTARISNRPATREEIEQSRPWLLKEIDILRPGYIVTLGNVPLRAVAGDSRASIGAAHGKVGVIVINGCKYKLYPLYHPASIIYNPGLKEIYINDIKGLKKLITDEARAAAPKSPGL